MKQKEVHNLTSLHKWTLLEELALQWKEHFPYNRIDLVLVQAYYLMGCLLEKNPFLSFGLTSSFGNMLAS